MNEADILFFERELLQLKNHLEEMQSLVSKLVWEVWLQKKAGK